MTGRSPIYRGSKRNNGLAGSDKNAHDYVSDRRLPLFRAGIGADAREAHIIDWQAWREKGILFSHAIQGLLCQDDVYSKNA